MSRNCLLVVAIVSMCLSVGLPHSQARSLEAQAAPVHFLASGNQIDASEVHTLLDRSRTAGQWLGDDYVDCHGDCACQPSCEGCTACGGGCLFGPWRCDDCACEGDCRCDDVWCRGPGGRYDANYFNRPNLLWVIRPTDTRFLNFISPMTNPVYFEDPRNLTEARVLFLNHWLPGYMGGGAVQLLATQVRVAFTERLSLIATKDGYIFQGSSPLPLEGWANVALGLKYNLYANAAQQRLISIGSTYELASGSNSNLQGNGDGQFNIFATGGTQIGQYSHFVSAAGFRLPVDRAEQNQQFYWSWHVDRRLRQIPLYGLLELNWYHWMTSGTSGIDGIGGLDLYNLGSAGVSGQNIVTAAVGVRYKFTPLNEVGVAWEAPISNQRDIMDNRITADFIIRW